jgi:hypothetical protein
VAVKSDDEINKEYLVKTLEAHSQEVARTQKHNSKLDTEKTEMSGFGKANIETQFDGFKYFKLRTPDVKKGETETTLIVRLLPSMKSYRDSGEWKFFYGQHYGYAGVNSRDPSKPRSRPFGCIQKKNKNKEIVTRARSARR